MKSLFRVGALVAFYVFLCGLGIRVFAGETGEIEEGKSLLQAQVNELRQKYEELDRRVSALINSRLPSKIDFCGETVPQERLYVRRRLEQELLFLSRKQFTLYMKRSALYFPYIEKRLLEWKMPDCLKYLPVIESALKSRALSGAGAYGIWQFIPSTAERYGLKVGLDYDERANSEKATDAALSYLWDNCKFFKGLGAKNCWSLAMAGYNSGEGNVEKAARAQKTFDYFDLWLPAEETRQYVYRAIVAQLVMSNPRDFGFYLEDVDLYQWPKTREVSLVLVGTRSVVEIAFDYKVSVVEFLELNPWINTGRGKKSKKSSSMTLPKGIYKFKIPVRD